jgi:hypothetical protein
VNPFSSLPSLERKLAALKVYLKVTRAKVTWDSLKRG